MNQFSFQNGFKRSLMLLWVSHLFMDFFTGIWPIYKTLAKVDIAQAGLIMGISGFLGEILQIFFGYFSDTGHRKKVLLLGLTLASAIIWITFSKGIHHSFFILLLLMLGSGAYHPAAAGMASSLAGQEKGKVILFFASGGAIGYGVSQLVFTKLMSMYNGHALLLLVPVGIVILGIAFHKFPNIKTSLTPVTSLKGFLQPIMHCKKPLLLLYLSQVFNQAINTSFLFLLPDLLQGRACHSWLCFGGGHMCFILGSALTMIPAGYLCDRYGQKKILLTILTAASALLFLFLTSHDLPFGWTMGLLAILGSFLGIVNPIIISWGNRLVPEHPSTVSAILMGFAWCIGNLGIALAASLSKLFFEHPAAQALLIMAFLVPAALFLILQMPKTESSKQPGEAGGGSAAAAEPALTASMEKKEE